MATNRLPIVGGEAGHQPAMSTTGNVHCVHNGEIYNFRQLAVEAGLEPQTSQSDTAVLVELLSQWGVARTLEALDWEGAFISIERATGIVTAARDHLGIKPLYFVLSQGAIVFASEIKALVPLSTTIQEVPAGTFLTFSPGSLTRYRVTRWWTAERSFPSQPELGALEAVSSSVKAAVRARVPNEPYAVMLSGGLDSSLILRHAIEVNDQVTAFVLHRPGSPDIDIARRLCRQLGVKLTEVQGLSPQELWLSAPTVVKIVETWEWHVINHAAPMLPLVDAIARSGLRVVLTGEGADEAFLGYVERYENGVSISSDYDLSRRQRQRLSNLSRTNCQRLDRMSMYKTLECRVPFLDRAVIETALSLPISAHLKNGQSKSVLKDAARSYLPNYVVDRPKLSLAKGAGYEYNQETGGGVFDWTERSRDASSENAGLARIPFRFPVERLLAQQFVDLRYNLAEFLETATI